MGGETAERLLLGTAIYESGLVYLTQHGNGPARGVYQMEPTTHDDIWRNFIGNNARLRMAIEPFMSQEPGHQQLVTNLAYATAMARLHYRRVREALPHHEDLYGIARYYKVYYNTRLGAGSIDGFMQKTGKYIMEDFQ